MRSMSRWAAAFGAAGALSVWIGFAGAGDLTPPTGPVGGTMKTLEAVEPRIALGQDTTPGDFSAVFRITAPGSYYLTSDVTATDGASGIVISVNDVTIDLMGFTLRGSGLGLGDGVRGEGNLSNLTVRNGVVTDFQDGVNFAHTSVGARAIVADLQVCDNLGRGIRTTNESIVRDCIIANNGGDGLVAGPGTIVQRCTVTLNGGRGLALNLTSAAIDCVISFNSGAGVQALEGSRIFGCLVRVNSAGIEVTDDAFITGNNIDSCSVGVLVTGSDCRVDGNAITDCATGVDINGTGNFVVRNTVSGGTAYSIVSGNKVGVIVSAPSSGAISGATGGAGVGTTDPWANFTF